MCLVSAVAVAQNSEPTNPDNFSSDLKTLLGNQSDPVARENGWLFDSLWTVGAYTSAQQEQIKAQITAMQERRYRPVPHISSYLGTIARAEGYQLSELLPIADQLLQDNDAKAFLTYLQAAELYLRQGALYASNYSSLYTAGGNVHFKYEKPAEPEPVAETPTEEDADDSAWFSDFDATEEEQDNSWSNDWGSWDSEPAAPAEASEPTDTSPVYLAVELPEVSGPLIEIDGTSLVFVSNNDSVALQNTKGSYMPLRDLWVGETGKFTWENTGLSPDSVYATFENYSFKPSKPQLTADEVSLTYLGRLSQAVKGVFEYKSTRYASPEQAQFPRFKSYESNIPVNGLGKDIIYRGGFALMGPTIYSSSVNSGLATIEKQAKGKPGFVIRSTRFNLLDTAITADRSALVLFHNQDSIFHPAVQSKYNTNTGVLTVIKDKGGFRYTPFYSSYFQMEFLADILSWDTATDSVDFSILSGKNQVPAYFTSQDYFNERRFEELKGLYDFHPLQLVVGYARRNNSSSFYVDEVAASIRQNPATVKNAMQQLMQSGYIDFDPQSGLIKMNRKGYHYVLSQNKRKDYDNLLISSLEPSQPNATFYLDSAQLKVRGIDQFYISRPKDVYITPTNSEITLLKNRNFEFDGKIHAGNFIFNGQNLRFDYDSFLIDLPQIDSIQFDVDNFKNKKNLKRKRLDNQLAETSGKLYIDLPNNKSSRRENPQYPIFDANQGSTVYFDRKEIAGGSYSKNITFDIPPFEIDSLSSSDPSAISFRGTFSSGIFPDFEETLVVLEDNSLGFTHKVPAGGYPLYNKQGTYYDSLKLDQEGLHGSGRIEYLSSKLYSNKFFFYEDSTNGQGYKTKIDEATVGSAQFPAVEVAGYSLNWYPKADSMLVSNNDEVFNMFGGVAQLNGQVNITTTGLLGSGTLESKGSVAVSEEFDFNRKDFNARHADFTINSNTEGKPILAAKDARVAYDLTKGVADISPEIEGVAALEFPYAQYRTSIPQATWNLEEKTVVMNKPDDFDILNSYFYTTNKAQDSLAFMAEEALYDIDALKLTVKGIPYIKVADAKITPENNLVEILENAQLETLVNATIVMDTLNEYHNLYNGNIKIDSRNRFEGNATYRLVNSLEDTFSIQFDRFDLEQIQVSKKETELHTVSNGEVKENEQMIISPGMLYKGRVTMYAHKPALELDGLVKLNFQNIPNYDTWIKYQSSADQKEIAFNFNQSKTELGAPLSAGIFYDSRTSELYPSFVTPKRDEGDQPLFSPTGILSYTAATNEYRIEDIDKKTGKSYSGRIFAYNENNSEVRFEGPIMLKPEVKGSMNVKASGLGKGSFQTEEFDMNTFMAIDFVLPKEAEAVMAQDMVDYVQRLGLARAHGERSTYIFKLAEIVGEKAAREWEGNSLTTYTPLVEAGPELEKNLVISNLSMKWSAEKKAWYSINKISVSNVGLEDINAQVDGFVEYRKSAELGTVLNIFLQVAPGVWYYFNFEGNRLMTYSSHEPYNEEIRDNSRADKAKPGEYVVIEGDIAETKRFVDRFRLDYFGLEVPYDLNLPQTAPEVSDDPFSTGTQATDTDSSSADDDDDGF
jgi:hypothetical protein